MVSPVMGIKDEHWVLRAANDSLTTTSKLMYYTVAN